MRNPKLAHILVYLCNQGVKQGASFDTHPGYTDTEYSGQLVNFSATLPNGRGQKEPPGPRGFGPGTFLVIK